jgi:hypothetical protein
MNQQAVADFFTLGRGGDIDGLLLPYADIVI